MAIDKITLEQLLENNNFLNPWNFLIQEASNEKNEKNERLTDVNSDDEPDYSKKPKEDMENTFGSGDTGDTGNTNDEKNKSPKLSEEELQQLAMDLQQSEDPEAELKKLFDDKKINSQDVDIIAELLNSQANDPEKERAVQVNNIQEMVIRFSIYDKLNSLESKLNIFIENFPNVDETFYKDVAQIHEYIKIINTLIFNLEINLVYQLFANLEMKLIDLFTEYKNSSSFKKNIEKK